MGPKAKTFLISLSGKIVVPAQPRHVTADWTPPVPNEGSPNMKVDKWTDSIRGQARLTIEGSHDQLGLRVIC